MFCHFFDLLIPSKCRKQCARLRRLCRRKKMKSTNTQSQLLSNRVYGTELSTLNYCQYCISNISDRWSELPTEILLQISSWLDPLSALALSRATRRLRETLTGDNVGWRQHYKKMYPLSSYRERELLTKLRRSKRISTISRLGLETADGGWLETMAKRASTEHRWRTDAGIISTASLQPLAIAPVHKPEKRYFSHGCNETIDSIHEESRRNSSRGSSRHSKSLSVKSLFPSSLWLHAAVEFTVALYNGRLYVRGQKTLTWRRLLPAMPKKNVHSPAVIRSGDAVTELKHMAIEGVKVHGRYVRGLGCLDSGDYWDFFWDALPSDSSIVDCKAKRASSTIAHQLSFAAFREGAMEIVGDQLLLQDFGATSPLAIYDLRSLATQQTSAPNIPRPASMDWLQGEQASLASYMASESLPGYLLAAKLHATATIIRCFSLDLNHWSDPLKFMHAVDIPIYTNGSCSWIELAAGGFHKECAIVYGYQTNLSGDNSFLMRLNPTLGTCEWYAEITQLEIATVRVLLDCQRIVLLSSESQLLIHDLTTGQPLHRLSFQVSRGPRLDTLDHILGSLLLVSDHAVSTEDPSGQTIVLVDVAQGRELWRRRIQRTESIGHEDIPTNMQRASLLDATLMLIPPRLTVCATHMLVSTLSRRTIIELAFSADNIYKAS